MRAAAEEAVLSYPFGEENGLDVDPIYGQLQSGGPIKVQMPYGESCWLATSYEDVRAVHVDRRFSKAAGVGRDVPRREGMNSSDPALLANMDPPEHTRLRRLASGAFSPARMRRLRGWVVSLVDQLLNEMIEGGQPGDFYEGVAKRLPNAVMTGVLGVPPVDAPVFRRWIDRMLALDTSVEDRREAQGQLEAYIADRVSERRRDPTGDLLSILVHAHEEDDRLNEKELVMLCLSLFLGGFETTVAQLNSTIYVLMTQRSLWEELQHDPGLMPAALEELWRWIPGHRYGKALVRWAVEDVELSQGVLVRAGDPVLPERPVANRDEAVFPHGWDLDFHRVSPKPHLTLGFGPHHCMGANLAHLEVEVTVRRLLTRLPSLELAVSPTEVRWSKTSFMRNVESLPIGW